MTPMAEFPSFFIQQKIHIIVMEDVDPDCKEWQDHEKENAILSIKGFADLIDESEVILTIQFSLDIKKTQHKNVNFLADL